MRTGLAVAAARVSAALSRRLKHGGATSLPGLVGLRIQPHLVRELRRGLAGNIVVTGTNGKTTTSRFIGEILAASKRPYVHNQSGSNLLRGIASVLTERRPSTGRSGQRRGAARPWGLFEVDEATMPAACVELAPKIVVVTNLFRDQLDRYGELKRTADYIRAGLAALPKSSTVILNADDPLVASLGKGLPQKVVYFGIEDASVSKPSLPHAADSITTPTGKFLRYDAIFTGHLGHYRSPDKSLKRPKPTVAATAVALDGMEGSRTTVKLGRRKIKLKLAIPGIYNVYNAVAAAAAGHVVGSTPAQLTTAIDRTAAAFGRAEHLTVDGRKVVIALVKNPTGAGEVIHTLGLDQKPKHLLVVLNDNFADGTDVSWIWDTEFEQLLPQAKAVTVSGTRADDLALRFKYAGLAEEDVAVYRSIKRALGESLKAVPAGEALYVLPTYTAMLELRKHLAEAGHLTHFLREDS